MKIVIYCIKNIINNKIYIGSTKNFKYRTWYHFNQLKNGKHHSLHLQRAYDKYGKSNFSYSIIEECNLLNRQERELYHIKINNSFDKNFGYNMYMPNEDNFTCSDETKDKMKLSKLLNKISISIDMYNLNGTFIKTYQSMNECKLETNIHTAIIHDIIKNKRKSYKGYTFVLKDEPFNYKPSNKQRSMVQYYK